MASEQQSSDFSDIQKEFDEALKQSLAKNLRVVVSRESRSYYSDGSNDYTKVRIFWGDELISEDYA